MIDMNACLSDKLHKFPSLQQVVWCLELGKGVMSMQTNTRRRLQSSSKNKCVSHCGLRCVLCVLWKLKQKIIHCKRFELSHCAAAHGTAALQWESRWERWSRRARTSRGAVSSLPSVQTDWLPGKDPWSMLPGASVWGTPSGQRERCRVKNRHG